LRDEPGDLHLVRNITALRHLQDRGCVKIGLTRLFHYHRRFVCRLERHSDDRPDGNGLITVIGQ